jgi:hypothetical protein
VSWIALQVFAAPVVVREVAIDSSLRPDHHGVDVVLAVDLVGAYYEAAEVVQHFFLIPRQREFRQVEYTIWMFPLRSPGAGIFIHIVPFLMIGIPLGDPP